MEGGGEDLHGGWDLTSESKIGCTMDLTQITLSILLWS